MHKGKLATYPLRLSSSEFPFSVKGTRIYPAAQNQKSDHHFSSWFCLILVWVSELLPPYSVPGLAGEVPLLCISERWQQPTGVGSLNATMSQGSVPFCYPSAYQMEFWDDLGPWYYHHVKCYWFLGHKQNWPYLCWVWPMIKDPCLQFSTFISICSYQLPAESLPPVQSHLYSPRLSIQWYRLEAKNWPYLITLVINMEPNRKPPGIYYIYVYIVIVVQLLSHVWLFVTPGTAACQASLSFTISQSLLKFMSIESVMPSKHLILCCPLLLLPSVFPSIRVFPNDLLFASGGQSIGASVSVSVLPVNIQNWFPLELTGLISLKSKGLSRVFFSTTVQKHQFFSAWQRSFCFLIHCLGL